MVAIYPLKKQMTLERKLNRIYGEYHPYADIKVSVILAYDNRLFWGDFLNNHLYCCGYLHECRTYCIGSNKYLQFVDQCSVCNACIAQIVKIVNNKQKVICRKINKQAVQLLERYLTNIADFKESKGTYSNLFIYYNNRGDIYNFNNQKIGTNAEFCVH